MLRKTYRIAAWKRWDFEVNDAVTDFYRRTHIYPNVLLASRITFAKINLLAMKKNVGKANGDEPGEWEYVDLTGFVGDGFELRFAENEKLQERQFALLYDANPDGDDGEPWPDTDTVTAAPIKKVS